MMAAQYVEVPFRVFIDDIAVREVLFERPVEDRSLFIRVFSGYPATPLGAHATGGVQRGRGQDAIRVVLLHMGQDARGLPRVRGVKKFPRVHRAGTPGAVVARVLERARSAWCFARAGFGADCRRCHGPAWQSGRCFFRCGDR